MIGDKTPDMKLPDCEWKRDKTPAWVCPFAGMITVNGKRYCKQHGKEAIRTHG